MKLKLFFVITILSSLSMYSQMVEGIIEYVIRVEKDSSIKQLDSLNIDPLMMSKMETYINNASELSLQLIFNDKLSRSENIEDLENDSKQGMYNINKIASGGDKITYTDLEKNITYIDNPKYPNILAEQTRFEWLITGETKLIEGYLCHKATTNQIVENSLGKQSIPIEAWFSRELSFPIGPYIYNGLPGIVLEVKRKSTIIKATKINLTKINNSISIIIPNKTILPQEEINRIAKRNFEAIKN